MTNWGQAPRDDGEASLRAKRGNPVPAQAQLLDRRVAFLLAMTGQVSLRAKRGDPVTSRAPETTKEPAGPFILRGQLAFKPTQHCP